MMSNNGFNIWGYWLSAWQAGKPALSHPWRHGAPPGAHFARLASLCKLSAVLCGYVYDCCPDLRNTTDFWRPVVTGCFGGLAKKFKVPELWEWAMDEAGQKVIENAAT